MIMHVTMPDGLTTITTEHAASSCGAPVLVHEGLAYGPADIIHNDTAAEVAVDMLLWWPRTPEQVEAVRQFLAGNPAGPQLNAAGEWQEAGR